MSKDCKYVIGIDFGSESVRAVVVTVSDGRELAVGEERYSKGILLDRKNSTVARHHPLDYVSACVSVVRKVLKQASQDSSFAPGKVVALGIDTTASTPLPLGENGQPLVMDSKYANNLNAMAWLWKDHSSYEEAREITEKALLYRPYYLKRIGGAYSSEWFWAKLLHCCRVDPEIFAASYTWVEVGDWIASVLAGIGDPGEIRRGICAAGHKALYNREWGGYPDLDFLRLLDPELERIGRTLPRETYTVGDFAGRLHETYASQMGLSPNIPISVPGIDAHIGALGCGIQEGVMVKIIGTSGVDLLVQPLTKNIIEIEGMCGIIEDSIRPGYVTIEAGQSAVGDVYNWFVSLLGESPKDKSHEMLTARAELLQPGESGLLALDWLNGNRSILSDSRLSGLLLGLTLHTKREEIYRSLIEATAFGARVILEKLEDHGLRVNYVIASGGIPLKNSLVMQILADVLQKEIYIAASNEASALGAAISASVVAGGHEDFDDAIKNMTRLREDVFRPIPEHTRVYDKLYSLYLMLHDMFGTSKYSENLFGVMKELADIRDSVKNNDENV